MIANVLLSGRVDASVGAYPGNTAQTGDSFARLGAPAGASIAADLAVIDDFLDTEIAAILEDTGTTLDDFLSRARAAEWGAYTTPGTASAPGCFPSKMPRAALATLGEKIIAHSPLHRLGDGEDLKGVVALLASDASRHITGQIIAVDGGASVA